MYLDIDEALRSKKQAEKDASNGSLLVSLLLAGFDQVCEDLKKNPGPAIQMMMRVYGVTEERAWEVVCELVKGEDK